MKRRMCVSRCCCDGSTDPTTPVPGYSCALVSKQLGPGTTWDIVPSTQFVHWNNVFLPSQNLFALGFGLMPAGDLTALTCGLYGYRLNTSDWLTEYEVRGIKRGNNLSFDLTSDLTSASATTTTERVSYPQPPAAHREFEIGGLAAVYNEVVNDASYVPGTDVYLLLQPNTAAFPPSGSQSRALSVISQTPATVGDQDAFFAQ